MEQMLNVMDFESLKARAIEEIMRSIAPVSQLEKLMVCISADMDREHVKVRMTSYFKSMKQVRRRGKWRLDFDNGVVVGGGWYWGKGEMWS
jgi:hypothetical protein